MKKYIFGLAILSLLVAPMVSSATGPYNEGDVDPNPNTGSCVSIVNNLRYQSRDVNTNGEVSTLQDFLQSKGYLNSEPTGYFGLLTVKAAKDFQSANGINPTGYVGPLTRAKISNLTCGGEVSDEYPIFKCTTGYRMDWSGKKCERVSGGSSVEISGVSGPQKLGINENGTWKVTASSKNGGNLSYSVAWGDEVYRQGVANPTMSIPQQTATFTHSYLEPGIYTVNFTVTSENTIKCIMAPCPSNAGSAQTSLTVNVGGVVSSQYDLTTRAVKRGEKTYQAGKNNVVIGEFEFTAPSEKDIDINDVVFLDWDNDANYHSNDGLRDFENLYLFANGKRISTYATILDAGFEFPGTSFTIKAKSSVRVVVKADIAQDAGNNSHAIQLAGFGSSATNLDWGSVEDYYLLVRDSVVNIGGSSYSSIKVLSPNGGETWIKGTTKTIKWKDNGVAPAYDIKLFSYNTPCNTCGAYLNPDMMYMSYEIAHAVSGSSYDWWVGNTSWDKAPQVPDGSYTIQVCQTGNSVCDSSDSYFKITSSTTKLTAYSSAIMGSQPTYNPGQTIKFSVQGIDSNENPGTPEKGFNVQSSMKASDPVYKYVPVKINGVYQSFNATYNYNTSAWDVVMTAPSDASKVYTIDTAFYCSNSSLGCASGQIDKSFDFTLSSAVPASIKVLSPNGGETWGKGTTQTIKWEDNTPIPYCINCGAPVPRAYSIYLKAPNAGEDSGNYLLALAVTGNSYNWKVGERYQTGSAIPDGSYTMQVCQFGTSICDSSNSYFKITSGVVSDLVITTASPLPNAKVGQRYTKSFYAKGLTEPGVGATFTLASGSALPPGITFVGDDDTCNTLYCLGSIGGTPTTAGTYTFSVYFAEDNGRSVTKRFTLTVDPSNTSPYPLFLRVVPTPVTPGGSVIATFANIPTPTATDWIGIYNGPDDTKFLPNWKYTNSCTTTAGSSSKSAGYCEFTMPTTPGDYEFRLFTNNGYTRLAISDTVTVSSPQLPVGVCSYPNPPAGFHYEGGQEYPTCGASLVPDVTGAVYNSMGANAISALQVPQVNSNTSTPKFYFTQFLSQGSYGPEVVELQKYLNNAGYAVGVVDGVFGSKVKAAVVQLQTANKLKADGIVGYEVRALLNR